MLVLTCVDITYDKKSQRYYVTFDDKTQIEVHETRGRTVDRQMEVERQTIYAGVADGILADPVSADTLKGKQFSVALIVEEK